MKAKYFKSGLFLAVIGMMFTACDSDRDDNPNIDRNNMTTEFKLNTPAYSTQLVDLATSNTVNFTWNQPNYGFAVPVTYSFQVSADDTWTDGSYADVTGSFTNVSGGVSGKALNNGICTIKGWTPDSELPSSMEIYMRCKAVLADLSVPAVYSNSVKLTVVPMAPVKEFAQFLYAIGDDSGWSNTHALRSDKDENGMYTGEYAGLMYLENEFKFRSDKDSWDIGSNWGVGAEENSLSEGGSNITTQEPGFYKVDVNMDKLTYELLKIDVISIIGTVNGSWDNDTDMTYNKETGAWEATATLNAGEMKFRVNHDWTWSWGGNGSGTAYNDLTYNSGANLALDADGTYLIQLFVSYEGNNKVVITMQ